MKRLFALLLIFLSWNGLSFIDPFDQNSCQQIELDQTNRCNSVYFPLDFLNELSGLSEFIDVDDERQDLAALSTQLKVYHFHRAQMAIQDHLVLLKGLGANNQQMQDALKVSGDPCEDGNFETIRSTLNEQASLMATELDKQPTTEEDQRNFFRKYQVAFMEQYRLKQILAGDRFTREQKLEARDKLETLESVYYLLKNPDFSHVYTGIVRDYHMGPLYNWPADAPLSTHADVETILYTEKRNDFSTEGLDDNYYGYLIHRIMDEDQRPTSLIHLLKDMIARSLREKVEAAQKICHYNDCEITYPFHDTFTNIYHGLPRREQGPVQKLLCECDYQEIQKTFSDGIVMTSALGTAALGGACLFFPPLCLPAAIAGGVHIAMTYYHNEDTSRNLDHARVEYALGSNMEDSLYNQQSGYHSLQERQSERFTSNMNMALLPMDVLVAPLRAARPSFVGKLLLRNSAQGIGRINKTSAVMAQFMGYRLTDEPQNLKWIHIARNPNIVMPGYFLIWKMLL